jgi:sterol desaturase/sphingolipid hydroxylase (fatty acid hydroxylase superfamily)
MNLKSAAFLALIGTLLLSLLLALDFINTISGVAQGAIASTAQVRSLIYLLASLGVTVFFYSYHRSQ